MSILSKPYFHQEEAAHAFLESLLWPHGTVCPHCGVIGNAARIKANPAKRVRYGLHKCRDCGKQFTVKMRTVFEHARIPLHKCLQAAYLMAASKKGISANQLARTLEITVKSAWFLAHRIREAMREGGFNPQAFGGAGHIVEIDETFIGRDKEIKPAGQRKGRGYAHKFKVLSLVDRATGRAKSVVVDDLKTETVMGHMIDNIKKETRIISDEASQYRVATRWFSAHDVVNHSDEEYVNAEDPTIHTNTIEGFFSIFKRGMKGVYQHCSKEHLHRYLAEFDFRYNNRIALEINDASRTERMLKGVAGKRLTYESAGARSKG